MKKLYIIGGGFAGVKTALELGSRKDLDITLISDRSDFLYYPALYSTATGHSQKESVVPLEEILRSRPRVKLIIDPIVGINPGRHILTGASGKNYSYDLCVLALGVVTSYFGLEGLDKFSYSIKSLEGLKAFKAHLHDEMIATKHLDKNYIVVGAGPTGVELSAALISYLERIRTAHKVRARKIRVSLVEAAPRVLPRMSEAASARVQKRLEGLGVKVMTNHKVKSQDDDSIIIENRDIPTKTVVWTSGVMNHPFYRDNAGHFELAANGRVIVDEHMQAAPDVYVIGDNAVTSIGLAQIALHDAQFVARAIKARLAGRPQPLYQIVDPPVVIPVGANWAVLEWKKILLTGRVASWIRKAADFIGYHDILPIGLALGVWRSGNVHEEDCPVCRGARESK